MQQHPLRAASEQLIVRTSRLDHDLEKVCAVLEHDLPQKLRAQTPTVGILQALQTYLIVVSLLLLLACFLCDLDALS